MSSKRHSDFTTDAIKAFVNALKKDENKEKEKILDIIPIHDVPGLTSKFDYRTFVNELKGIVGILGST